MFLCREQSGRGSAKGASLFFLNNDTLVPPVANRALRLYARVSRGWLAGTACETATGGRTFLSNLAHGRALPDRRQCFAGRAVSSSLSARIGDVNEICETTRPVEVLMGPAALLIRRALFFEWGRGTKVHVRR